MSAKAVLFLGLILCLQQIGYSQEKDARLINTVPKHLPLKLEIFIDGSDEILKDLKIKVTNTGAKPVYFLKFYVSVPEEFRLWSGGRISFPLEYGRSQFITFTENAKPDDIRLKKEESWLFSVNDGQMAGFLEMLKRESRSEPETYVLEFIHLSFGDCTGYTGPKGLPFHNKAPTCVRTDK